MEPMKFVSSDKDLLNETQLISKMGSFEYDFRKKQLKVSEGFKVVVEQPSHGKKISVDDLMQSLDRGDIERLSKIYDDSISCKNESVVQVDVPLRASNRTVKIIKVICRLHFQSDLCISIKGTVQDITEQAASKKELEEANEVWKLAQDFAGLGSWRLTIDTGQLYWSDSIYKLFNLDKDRQISFDTFIGSVHEEDREKVMIATQRCLEDGQSYEVEHRIIVNGQVRWLNEKGSIVRGENNRAEYMFGIVRDVTESKAAAEELLLSKARYQLLAESGHELIALHTLRGHFIYASPALRSLLGYDPNLMADDFNIQQLIHPDDKRKLKLAFTRVLKKEGQASISRIRLRHRNGSYVWCEISLRAVVGDGGEVDSVRSLTKDIEAQVAYESKLSEVNDQLKNTLSELRVASQSKENFLSIMSHEIRTPLNSVIGLSNLLIRSNPREDQLTLVKTLKSSADQLLNLVNDILDFNKIRLGKVELEKSPFSLHEFLGTQYACFKTLAQDKGLEFIVGANPGVPEHLEGDLTRLNQIFTNLISNAIKFTDTGTVRFTVDVVSKSDGNCRVNFSVHDTGIGIVKEKAKQIFEPFTQADADVTKRYGGTGLGLAIVKSLVDLMGGEIGFQSQPHGGTEFNVELDFSILEPGRFKATSSSRPTLTGLHRDGTRNISVLYVEDVESNRLLIENLLSHYSFECKAVESGEAALIITKQTKFDLILMDIQMPVMDGYQTTDMIRTQIDGKNRSTPIIAFTASPYSESIKSRVERHRIQYVISKPFETDFFLKKVIEFSLGDGHEPSFYSFLFYIEAFSGSQQNLEKIKDLIVKELQQFISSVSRMYEIHNFIEIHKDIHRIRPIISNLRCAELMQAFDSLKTLSDQQSNIGDQIATIIDIARRLEWEIRSSDISHNMN